MIQEHNVIGNAVAQRHRAPAAEAGIHHDPIAAQNALCHHQVHFLIVHHQCPNAGTGEGLPARGLGLREAPGPQLPVEQVGHGQGREGLVDQEQVALAVQHKLFFRDHDNLERHRQLLVIRPVFLVFRLGDEHVGQLVVPLQFEQSLKIVGLVSRDAQSLHQIPDQAVIISPDLVAAVPLRAEIARNAQQLRVVDRDTGAFVRHALGNRDAGVQAPVLLALKMDKAAHGVQQTPGDGQPQPQPAHKATATGVGLVKIVIHLEHLGVRHADSRVPYVDNQIDAVLLRPVSNADVDAALLRKFDGVFHQNLQHMGDFLRVPHQNRRHLGVDVKHNLQMLQIALQGCHGDDVVQHRGNHVLLLGRRHGALYDLGVVQHIVDLVGQAFSRHLDGGHVLPDIRGDLPPQGHLADADHHIDRRAQLVRHIGQKDSVLLSRRLQLVEHMVVPLPLGSPPPDPVPRQGRPAKGHNSTKSQAKGILELDIVRERMEDQGVV